MKTYLFLGLVEVCLLMAGCSSKGIPVEFANMCDKANNHKTIEVIGFLDNSGSAMCSTSVNKGPMRCGIRFKDSLSSEKWLLANIAKGSWSSEIENIEGQGLKIRDNNSEFITRQQKVKITASVRVFDPTPANTDPATACSLSVDKIEKAP